MDASGDSRDKITPEPASRISYDILVWAIIAVQLIVGVYGFIVLPDTVPIHWGVNSQPNGYGPKWVDTFLFLRRVIKHHLMAWVMQEGCPTFHGLQNAALAFDPQRLWYYPFLLRNPAHQGFRLMDVQIIQHDMPPGGLRITGDQAPQMRKGVL